MPYSVQFVGLVCFYRQPGERLALLPDGRNPEDGIDPHHASIVIAPSSLDTTTGWSTDEVDLTHADRVTFPLSSPCQITLEGADAPGDLDTSAHQLPDLRQINPDFEIDPSRAQTIAKVLIRRGTLTSYLIPGGEAAISELVVPHDGQILVTIQPDDGGAQRTIVAKAGAEIAIANMAHPDIYEETERALPSHFQIYEKLAVQAVPLEDPAVITGLSQSASRHPLFLRKQPVGLYVDCTNTGCCG
jgi:hypothetical protein